VSPLRSLTGSGAFEDVTDHGFSLPSRSRSLVSTQDNTFSAPLTGFKSPRPFDEPLYPPRSASLSTASSTPRRFPPVSPTSRGLRSTAEEDILDLFEEDEEKENQLVHKEIQGLMSNIQLDLLGGVLDNVGGTTKRGTHSLSLSTEEERLMQEILEDED